MNPYPFALLNHFTVPFSLSTKSPFSARPLVRGPEGVPAVTQMHFVRAGLGCQRKCVNFCHAKFGSNYSLADGNSTGFRRRSYARCDQPAERRFVLPRNV